MQGLLFEDRYQQIVGQRANRLADEIRDVQAEADAEGLRYANKPFPLFPRVTVLPAAWREEIARDAEAMLDVLEKVIRLYGEDEATRRYFMLDQRAQELVAIEPGYGRKIRINRFDTYLVPGEERFQILENNTDCPAGVIFTGRVYDVIRRIPSVQAYLQELPPLRDEPIHGTDAFVSILQDTYAEFRPGTPLRRVAILQVRGKASPEVREMTQVFVDRGLQAVIADPRDLVYKDGRLFADGVELQLIWNKINTADFIPLLPELEAAQDFLEACRDQAVCHMNSFQARFITESKLCMAYLCDPQFAHHFTAQERQLIARHIPWARKLTDGQVEYRGEQVDLFTLAVEQREQLVLKTSYDIRGEGVVLGVQTDPKRWEELLKECWDRDYIVQERVPAPEVPVPAPDGVGFAWKKCSADLFMFGGRFQGFGSKLSDELKVNIFQGGSKQPILSLAE